jgi:hypothetical protein
MTCAVVFFSLIGFAVDYDDPAYVIENELIEEISNAAGLALVDEYIADYTAEELVALTATGRTPGIRLAADRALFVINGRELELYGMELDALAALAEAGDQDAANMWFFKSRAGYKRPELVEEYIASATVETLERAAGVLLGGFYVPNSPLGAKTEAELLELAKNGESLGLRVAAATALTAIWVADQPLTISQTRAEILAVTLVYPELALAYQGYLAYLFSL